jgi:hypothetical protein
LGPTVTLGTPSRPDGGPRVSTTTVTAARATMMTMGTEGATTATTIVTVDGHRTSEVHGPLARASATRNFLCASGLQPMSQDTTGTPTQAYSSRTTGSHATPGERPTTLSSSRPCRSTSATLHALGSSTCRGTRSNWTDLCRVFAGNFQGTYMRPGKQWELRNCKK